MLLIISSVQDAHLDFVTKHLQGTYAVIDAGDIIDGKGLTYRLQNKETQVVYQGEQLDDVQAVWLRRPRNITHHLELPVAEQFEQYSKGAINKHIDQLYASFPKARWVSDRYVIERAENKIFQLAAASDVGFRVPDTAITSDPKEAESFVRKHGEVILKSLSDRSPLLDDTHYLAFYARRLRIGDVKDFDGLQYGPCIFQQLVEPDFDIRVTVMGDKVFAAKVVVNGDHADEIRDWHIGHTGGRNITVEQYKLSPLLTRQCIELVQRLGLQYGAIDLVRDTKGRTWFIEINPNGQWAFVEQETGLPMGATMAALLEGRA